MIEAGDNIYWCVNEVRLGIFGASGAMEASSKHAIESNPQGLGVFIAYARKDKSLQRRLKEHLAPLERENLIRIWFDGMITPGEAWEATLQEHLRSAEVVLLLISASFMSSDYCYETEMKQAVERHQRGAALVIPIILKPVDWHNAPFAALQALPEDARPVTTWSNRDKALANVAAGVRVAIHRWKTPALASLGTRPVRSRLDLLRDLPKVPPLR